MNQNQTPSQQNNNEFKAIIESQKRKVKHSQIGKSPESVSFKAAEAMLITLDWCLEKYTSLSASQRTETPLPNGWIRVKDALPELEQWVLSIDDEWEIKVTRLTTYPEASIGYAEGKRDKWFEYSNGRALMRHRNVTRWMPLPAPPSKEAQSSEPSLPKAEKSYKATYTFYRNDDAPYVGAYRVGTMTEGKPDILFNMDFEFQMLKDEPKGKRVEFLHDGMLQTLTHEFCHSLQEWLGKEFDELEVERILGAYNEKWNVFQAEAQDEIPEDVFKISDLLKWMEQSDAQTADDFKAQLNEVFMAHRLWIEAEAKAKVEPNDKGSDATTDAQREETTLQNKNYTMKDFETLSLSNVKIGDTVLRRKTNGGETDTWVKCTVNETYLSLIKEFPDDYKLPQKNNVGGDEVAEKQEDFKTGGYCAVCLSETDRCICGLNSSAMDLEEIEAEIKKVLDGMKIDTSKLHITFR